VIWFSLANSSGIELIATKTISRMEICLIFRRLAVSAIRKATPATPRIG
jgi:hypothetical protein